MYRYWLLKPPWIWNRTGMMEEQSLSTVVFWEGSWMGSKVKQRKFRGGNNRPDTVDGHCHHDITHLFVVSIRSVAVLYMWDGIYDKDSKLVNENINFIIRFTEVSSGKWWRFLKLLHNTWSFNCVSWEKKANKETHRKTFLYISVQAKKSVKPDQTEGGTPKLFLKCNLIRTAFNTFN